MALSRAQIKRLPDDSLLRRICEEASEVIKAVCKHGEYGPTPFAGGVQYDNVADTNEESSQLNELLYEYRRRFGFAGFRPLGLED